MKKTISSTYLQKEDDYLLISFAPIPVFKLIENFYDPRAGALVSFTGLVRNNSHGKVAVSLWYEAYNEMAIKLLTEILETAMTKWDLINAYCRHRIGTLQVGDIAVIVLTSSVHRKEAYEANTYIIDRVKFELPIWKKENYADGSNEWRHNCH